MSFYNPNIQAAFEDDTRECIKLKGVTLGSYKIVYKINDGCTVSDTEELRATNQLEFVRLENAVQQQNLKQIDEAFPALLGDIALEVMTGKVHSPYEYIVRKQPFGSMVEQYEALYEGDRIQNFIELLVYSDIASKHQSKGERDFTKIYYRRKTESESEYYTLFERLKLYDYLKKNIQLTIDRSKSSVNGREVILFFKLFV